MFTPERLAAIRGSLGLAQEGMARLLGVSFASVNRWENGHSSPTGTVMELYRALDHAIRAGKKATEILGVDRSDQGRLLHHIFQAAYGGR